MTVLSITATIVGTIMALSGVPQIIKIYQRKSVKDVSPATFFMLAIGGVVWTLYGYELKNLTIVFTNAIVSIVSTTVLLQYYFYKKTSQ